MDLQSLNEAATENEGGHDNTAMADTPTDPSHIAIEEANGSTVGEGYELPSVQFESKNGLSSPVDSKANSSAVPPGTPLGSDRSEHMTSVLNVDYPDADAGK